MPKPKTTTNAIIFDEGPGYILIRALTHGDRAQSYLTLSLNTSTLYCRKKLIPSFTSLIPHSDARFAPLVHPSIAPQLINSIPYPHVGDALYFRFCNGGDLRVVIDGYAAKGECVPEVFIWYWLKLALEHIVYLHYPLDHREGGVDPLIHRDIWPWQGNYFLHWPSSPSPSSSNNIKSPQIFLGDFGSAQYVSEGDLGRGLTGIGNDIYSIAFVLMVLLLGKPLPSSSTIDQIWGLIPDLYSDEIKQVATNFATHLIGTRFRITEA